eukprot:TRINITY_DN2408_c0_g1_i3.p1 TRINITY_DN2408_c0_g1~~TRINITY_DN2408_c0_g1_i3.p1  ORF type:complete len:390 (+),score=79.05 TRINITY_DN2408_c0_g1_i3:418-1587(+)
MPYFNLSESTEDDILVVQSTMPLKPFPFGGCNVGYFEVTFENQRLDSYSIGLAPKGYQREFIGLGKYSCGATHDGNCYIQNFRFHQGGSFYFELDSHIFGCGINFETKEVFFTLNGMLLTSTPLPPLESSNDRLYPSISLGGYEECVLNFGSKPFEFDIMNYALSQKTDFCEYDKIKYPVFDMFDSIDIYRDISKDYRKGYVDKFEILDGIRTIYTEILYFSSSYVIEECTKSEINPGLRENTQDLLQYIEIEEHTELSPAELRETLLIRMRGLFEIQFLDIARDILEEIKIMKRERTFYPGSYGDMFFNLELMCLYFGSGSDLFRYTVLLKWVQIFEDETGKKGTLGDPQSFTQISNFFCWKVFFDLVSFLEKEGGIHDFMKKKQRSF